MLLGREAEQRIVDETLQKARGGRSAVLVLRGEPGIGKTALLGYAECSAGDMTVLRCAGVEAEHEFPFAGLHQLLRPCLGLMDRLAAPQHAALRNIRRPLVEAGPPRRRQAAALGRSVRGRYDRHVGTIACEYLRA